jgi:hypothetical protein
MLTDPKSTKYTLKLSVFFALLGSAHVKAACKHDNEIDPLVSNLPTFYEQLLYTKIPKVK